MANVYPRPFWFDLAGEIAWEIAEEMARRRQRRLKRPPIPRGKTLRPGAGTPCWNLLVVRVTPLLRRRGAKTLLARALGLNRGRVTEFFVQRSAMPDAERLLRLLDWLSTQAAPTRRRAATKRSITAPSSLSPAIPVPVVHADVRNTNIC